MQRGIAVLCALVIGRLFGRDLFLAAVFGTLGFFIGHMVLRMRIKTAPYPLFLLLLSLGMVGEILSALNQQFANQEHFYWAWLFFLPTLFFLFFSRAIRGQGRKIWGIGYAVFLMLLHLYGKAEMGETATLSFLPMQLSFLYVIISGLKQKNDAS
ncbi:MAG: hypothetical protein IJN74_03580 [Clostridia bacterium]|nr:hypothetical protein [Clostridia bacterium]